MYWTLLKNDIKYNRLQSFNIAFFIILSVAFLAAAGQLTIRLNDSIHSLLEKAETPHLLQMHTGEINMERMKLFVESHPEIEEYQILEFLNIDQSLLAFNGVSLKDFVYDNGFSVQSPKFDYLLDLKGNKINPKIGEVYVPILYQSAGLVKEGDILSIRDHRLKVTGFVRDSQMNSSISISKRFIINEEDYSSIKALGNPEYLIEFRLHDLKDSSKIEAAYAESGLESNGPPFLSYRLFKIVNAFSDGITIIALLLIGMLIIGISLLCIRFTLLAKLEEDYRELAVLKAIGISPAEIRLLFLAKYLFIAGISSIAGFFLSFLLKRPFLANMKMFFGETQESGLSYAAAFILSALIFLVIYLYMNKLSKRLKYLKLNENAVEEKEIFFHSLSNLPKMLQLVISDFFARKRMYFTLVSVFVLSVFILTIPMSIYSTISDKNFVNYLGVGVYDIRIDISETAKNEEALQALLKDLEKDPAVDKFELYTGKLVDYRTEEGTRQKLWIDSGKQSSFPIRYISGKAPLSDYEIALSKLASDELSKKEGDSITLLIGNEERVLRVSGIFSDLTNGGKTAKTNFRIDEGDTVWTVIPIRLHESSSVRDFMEDYTQRYSFARFADTETYLKQIFGNTIVMVENITKVALAACLFLVLLIVSLFVRMMYLKDRGQNAILKSIGFSNRSLYLQYMAKTVFSLSAGILAGNLLVLSVGDRLTGKILSLIGVSGVHFVRNPIFTYFLVPFAMLLSAVFATIIGVKGLSRMNIAEFLKEE